MKDLVKHTNEFELYPAGKETKEVSKQRSFVIALCGGQNIVLVKYDRGWRETNPETEISIGNAYHNLGQKR